MPHAERPDIGYERRSREAELEDADSGNGSQAAAPTGRYVAPRKRPITVTVEGDRNSGKTTLIAILAQALENSNHLVAKPAHVPTGSMAVRDLHEQFDITFVEAGQHDDSVQAVASGEAPATATDAINDGPYTTKVRMRQRIEELTHARNVLSMAYAELETTRQGQVERLDESRKARAELFAEKAKLVQAYEDQKEAHAELRVQADACRRENAQLRATIDELRGSVAGLGNNVGRLQSENEALKSLKTTLAPGVFDRTVALIRQAVRLEDEREKVKAETEQRLKRVDYLQSQEAEALRLAHDAITGSVRLRSGTRTLREQAAAIPSRDTQAHAKLLAANIALMGEEGFAGWGVEGEGC